jgi:hypothetical protein
VLLGDVAHTVRRLVARVGGRTTVVAVVAVVLLALVWFATRDDGTGEQSTSFSYNCAPVSAAVAGLPEGEVTTLMGCLDGTADQPGPGIAIFAVDRDAAGALTFNPAATVARGATVAAAASVFEAATGAAVSPYQGALNDVPDPYVGGVRRAIAAGIATTEGLSATTPTSRGDLALVLYGALTKGGVVLPAGTPAADSASVPEPYRGAEAALAEAGITDTAPGDAYRFNDPVTRAEWVTMVGRAWYEASNPGAMAQRRSAAPQQGATTAAEEPTSSSAPSPPRVEEILAALTSGDRARARSVVADAGDDVNVALQTAAFAGYRPTGLKLTSGPASGSGDSARAELTVVDGNGTTLAGGEASYIRRDGVWLLEGWPTIGR